MLAPQWVILFVPLQTADSLPLVVQTRGRGVYAFSFFQPQHADFRCNRAVAWVAKLSNDRKAIVKELIEAFLLKTDLQQKRVH